MFLLVFGFCFSFFCFVLLFLFCRFCFFLWISIRARCENIESDAESVVLTGFVLCFLFVCCFCCFDFLFCFSLIFLFFLFFVFVVCLFYFYFCVVFFIESESKTINKTRTNKKQKYSVVLAVDNCTDFWAHLSQGLLES